MQRKRDWSSFFPIHEKSVLFAWMAFPLLVIAVIYISFTDNYVPHIRIYNFCTAPLYFLIVIWLSHSFMSAPCIKKRDKHHYSKPIALVLQVTLWGSVIGRMALLTLKVFCYDTKMCHHPVTDAKTAWELTGGMLDDLTDISVLIALFLYIRHTIKHDFIEPNRNKFLFQKHLILAVLVLLFFQIAAQELHELIHEKDLLKQKEEKHLPINNGTVSERLDGQIQNAIEFIAPFTFLLSTELIGLLFGLALVMDVGNNSSTTVSMVSLGHTMKRFMGERYSGDNGSILKKTKDRCNTLALPIHTDFQSSCSVVGVHRSLSSPGFPESLRARTHFREPEEAPEITRWQSDGNVEEEPTARQSVSQEDLANDPPRYDLSRRTLRQRNSMGQSSSRSRSKAVSWLIIGLSLTLALGEFCEFAQKTYLYGRFHSSQITIINPSKNPIKPTNSVHSPPINVFPAQEIKRQADYDEIVKNLRIRSPFMTKLLGHDFEGSPSTENNPCNASLPTKTTFMGRDREISDIFNSATNIWASILYLVMIYKILDGLNQGDYIELPANDHSKIDKLFLFFTATLWSIAIGIYTAADFLVGTQYDCTHSYQLSTIQKWSGLINQITMLLEIWLQLVLLQIQLSISLPHKVTPSHRLHHWAHIIALHSILLLDLVEWFSFFFEQQFTKHLLPFYPDTLLIPTRLLTPYIGMYLFHAICCWMIVRVNFKKKSYFQLGSEVPTEADFIISPA